MTKVAVLLSAFNGSHFIREQIDSILNQKDVETELIVRDDGSTDNTREILEEYKQAGKLTWYTGKNLKAAGSFMDLIHSVVTDAEFIALSDQDDVWLPDKLYVAVTQLRRMSADKPALYYGKTCLVDRDLKEMEQESVTFVSSTMKQSVISSGCTGCTICMNRPLFELLRQKQMGLTMIHDMWIHKICVAVGGELFLIVSRIFFTGSMVGM